MVPAANFSQDEDGGATTFGLLLITACLMLGGYAIDVGNVMRARTELQVSTDAAAHAALLSREDLSAAAATAKAVEIAALNMPVQDFGTILNPTDIQFGDWDDVARSFTPNASSKDAVRVTARQAEVNGNPLDTYLMKLVGFDQWDIAATSTFTTYHPTCLREGFVAQQRIDLQSNNNYSTGFCIHSNGTMELNQNNYFEPGTVVSLSDIDNLELPASGYNRNEGLADALHEGSWNIRIVERIDDIIAGLYVSDPRYVPDYITSSAILTLPNNKKLAVADFTPGRIHKITCASGGGVSMNDAAVLRNVVLVTNCRIVLGNSTVLEDVVFATTSTAARAISGANGLQIGRNDNCAAGGGAQLITMGSINVASGLRLYGGQLMAKKDILFTANADGVQGAAMVAGGTISGTSNMNMGFCGTGMEDNYHAEYFKLVE